MLGVESLAPGRVVIRVVVRTQPAAAVAGRRELRVAHQGRPRRRRDRAAAPRRIAAPRPDKRRPPVMDAHRSVSSSSSCSRSCWSRWASACPAAPSAPTRSTASPASARRPVRSPRRPHRPPRCHRRPLPRPAPRSRRGRGRPRSRRRSRGRRRPAAAGAAGQDAGRVRRALRAQGPHRRRHLGRRSRTRCSWPTSGCRPPSGSSTTCSDRAKAEKAADADELMGAAARRAGGAARRGRQDPHPRARPPASRTSGCSSG